MKHDSGKMVGIFGVAGLLILMAGCGMSLRMGTQHSIDKMSDAAFRAKAAETSAGYQEGNGVPSVSERFAERPGLKIGVLQFAMTIQGDVSRDFADVTNVNTMALSAKFGVRGEDPSSEITIERKTLDAIEVPPKAGFYLATHGLKKLEYQLIQAGFDVIDSDRIVKTKAYKKFYGEYPPFGAVEKGSYAITSMAAGWTTFAPLNHRIKVPTGVIKIGQAHFVWPDTKALQEIAAELGEDILFITMSTVFTDHQIVGKGKTRSRVGVFGSSSKAALMDPKFVGYGIGGFGHMSAQVSASLASSKRLKFLKENKGKFTVDWQMLVKEAEDVNDYYARAFANTLKELKTKAK